MLSSISGVIELKGNNSTYHNVQNGSYKIVSLDSLLVGDDDEFQPDEEFDPESFNHLTYHSGFVSEEKYFEFEEVTRGVTLAAHGDLLTARDTFYSEHVDYPVDGKVQQHLASQEWMDRDAIEGSYLDNSLKNEVQRLVSPEAVHLEDSHFCGPSSPPPLPFCLLHTQFSSALNLQDLIARMNKTLEQYRYIQTLFAGFGWNCEYLCGDIYSRFEIHIYNFTSSPSIAGRQGDSFVIEFQRMEGDTNIFGAIYQQIRSSILLADQSESIAAAAAVGGANSKSTPTPSPTIFIENKPNPFAFIVEQEKMNIARTLQRGEGGQLLMAAMQVACRIYKDPVSPPMPTEGDIACIGALVSFICSMDSNSEVAAQQALWTLTEIAPCPAYFHLLTDQTNGKSSFLPLVSKLAMAPGEYNSQIIRSKCVDMIFSLLSIDTERIVALLGENILLSFLSCPRSKASPLQADLLAAVIKSSQRQLA